mmetsp:Transcript_107847/g.230272  ORF Transcript_107847/g.230272 Transcript_107847/m.230272 type:complete len:278 (+) Transcript_107847:291-1124(+)
MQGRLHIPDKHEPHPSAEHEDHEHLRQHGVIQKRNPDEERKEGDQEKLRRQEHPPSEDLLLLDAFTHMHLLLFLLGHHRRRLWWWRRHKLLPLVADHGLANAKLLHALLLGFVATQKHLLLHDMFEVREKCTGRFRSAICLHHSANVVEEIVHVGGIHLARLHPHARRHVRVTNNSYLALEHVLFVLSSQCAIPATHCSQVHDHGAWSHVCHHVVLHESWGGPPRDSGGQDDDVARLRMPVEGLLLRLLKLLRALLGIPTRACTLLLEVHCDPTRSQ